MDHLKQKPILPSIIHLQYPLQGETQETIILHWVPQTSVQVQWVNIVLLAHIKAEFINFDYISS